MNLYEALGVERDAHASVIKGAYRKLAMRLHPDRGGNKDAMAQVQLAHDILMDPERRKHYDKHGTDIPPDVTRDRVLQDIQTLLLQALEKEDVDHTDLVGVLRDVVKDARKNHPKAIEAQKAAIEKRKRAAKRMKGPNGANILRNIIEQDIQTRENVVKQMIDNLKLMDEVEKFLKDYSYKIEVVGWLTSNEQQFTI